jgi:regulator of cell morphogenesis and NO signaling
MMTNESIITPDLRINEVIRMIPSTVETFHELGLDACCGGDRTIAEAALAHGLSVQLVLEALSVHSPPMRIG